jgi:hypothetical protein
MVKNSEPPPFSYLYCDQRNEEYLQHVADYASVIYKLNGHKLNHNPFATKQLITKNNFANGPLAIFTKAYHSQDSEAWTTAREHIV